MTTPYTIAAGFSVALGGILFGYDIGIISGALLPLVDQFGFNCFQQEMLVSSMLFGALFASLVGGILVDYLGRRVSLIGNSLVFIIGAILLTSAGSFTVLIAGRFLVGFGVSVSAIGECVYISEVAPANRRGVMVSLNELGISCGFLLAYLINLAFINITNGWRYMFALALLPALLQGIVLSFLPPSPRFLVIRKKEEEARKVLIKLRGTEEVDHEFQAIRASLGSETSGNIFDLCRLKDNMFFRFLIGIGLVLFQQCTGHANVLYYGPTIFLLVGFGSNSAAVMSTVVLGTVKVVFTIVSLSCVDRAGRRKLLISGALMMFTGIICLSFATLREPPFEISERCRVGLNYDIGNTTIHYELQNTTQILEDNIREQNQSLEYPLQTISTNGTQSRALHTVHAYVKWIALFGLVVYVSGYALGFGPVTWILLGEMYPSHLRGRAISIATVANWGMNLIISSTFLNLLNALTLTGTFFLYTSICAVSLVYITLFVPETKGLSLEEISSQLKHRRLSMAMSWCGSGRGSRERLAVNPDGSVHYSSVGEEESIHMAAGP